MARPLDDASQEHPIHLFVFSDKNTRHDTEPWSNPLREGGVFGLWLAASQLAEQADEKPQHNRNGPEDRHIQLLPNRTIIVY